MNTVQATYTPPGGRPVSVLLTPASPAGLVSSVSPASRPSGASVLDEASHAEPRYCVTLTAGEPNSTLVDEHLARATKELATALGLVSAKDSAGCLVERMTPAAHLLEPLGVNASDVAIAIRRAFEGALNWQDIDFEVIYGPVLDPQVNVALDETLAHDVAAGRRKPFMRIWEWTGTQVVLGSYQSYANELHASGVERHNVTVSRRVSGGGTMFMEADNSITFSLVVPTALVAGMSFEQAYPFLDQWVMKVLADLGVRAHYVPLNDIASDRGKIAGAAQKRWANGYMLHHVTMAYDMDTAKMLEVLRTGLDKVHDKGTRSAVKWVDPLRSQIDLPRHDVIRAMIAHFRRAYGAQPAALTAADIEAATARCAEKFDTPEWIYRLP